MALNLTTNRFISDLYRLDLRLFLHRQILLLLVPEILIGLCIDLILCPGIEFKRRICSTVGQKYIFF